jgi:hypothetical protein
MKIMSANLPPKDSEVAKLVRAKTKLEGKPIILQLDYKQEYADIEKRYLNYKNVNKECHNEIKIVNHDESTSNISNNNRSNTSSNNSSYDSLYEQEYA